MRSFPEAKTAENSGKPNEERGHRKFYTYRTD